MTVPVVDQVEDVVNAVARHARERGGQTALDVEGAQLTFAELDRRVAELGEQLHAAGAAGRRVCYLGQASTSYFELVLAGIRAGVVVIPLNWRLSPHELAAVLDDSDAVALVATPSHVVSASTVLEQVSARPALVPILGDPEEDWSGLITALGKAADVEPVEEASAVVLQIYTSGTTGRPKGVLTTRPALNQYLDTLGEVADLHAGGVSLSTMPLFHIGGTGWALASIYRGATTLLLHDTDPDRLLTTAAQASVTTMIAAPVVVQRMVNSPVRGTVSIDSLRTLYYGGGPMPPSVLAQGLEAFGCDFVQGFGMTECPLATALSSAEHAAGGDVLTSCGRPVRNTRTRLVDPESGHDVPTGQVGELWIRSPLVTPGYWRQPDQTAAAITPDGWLRTGDLGRHDDEGRLYLTDRLKDMIVTGGENVYSGEVENVLITHPAVVECAVVGVPSEKWTETVKGFVVLHPDAGPVTPQQLIAYCRDRLAHYKCPTSIEMVPGLPRTPSGKVRKVALRERVGTPGEGLTQAGATAGP